MGIILKNSRYVNYLLFETSIILYLSASFNLFFGSGISTRGR